MNVDCVKRGWQEQVLALTVEGLTLEIEKPQRIIRIHFGFSNHSYDSEIVRDVKN